MSDTPIFDAMVRELEALKADPYLDWTPETLWFYKRHQIPTRYRTWTVEPFAPGFPFGKWRAT